jgi:hypothetical protein
MPLTWINEMPEPDEREPNPRDRQEIDWESRFDIEIREAQKAAYLACQQEADELYARLMEED